LPALLVAVRSSHNLLAVLLLAVVEAHPLAQPMSCLEPGLIQPVYPVAVLFLAVAV